MTTTPAMPEHTIGKHDHPEPHTMCWSELELAAIKRYAESYALATLQAQPAEVSDAEILRVVDAHVGGPTPSYPLDPSDWISFARAILALRPQPVPMTDEQAKQFLKRSALLDMFLHIGWYSAPRKGFDEHALSLIRAVEAHHGITAPAGGEVDRG